MTVLLAGAIAALVFVLVASRVGLVGAIFASALVSVTIFPAGVVGLENAHAGVTNASPRVFTYTLVVALGAGASLLFQRGRKVPFAIWTFTALLVGWAILFWEPTPNVISGVLHYGTGALAWLVGVSFASLPRPRIALDTLLVNTVLIILVVELIVSGAQLAGVNVPFYGGGAYAGGYFRVSGTFGHPGNFGKALFLIATLVLPASRSVEAKLRKRALVVIALIILLTGLTLGRANIIALISMLVLWLLLDRAATLGVRLRATLLVGALALPFLQSVLGRFYDDPTGGERPELTSEAFDQLQRTPFAGTGANNYVEEVGQFGWATAAGFPVHNSVLLILVELGVPLALLFFMPYMGVILSGVRSLGPRRSGDLHGRALLVSLPGILVTALTGWGLVAGPVLVLWAITYSYLGTASRAFSAEPAAAVLSNVPQVDVPRLSSLTRIRS